MFILRKTKKPKCVHTTPSLKGTLCLFLVVTTLIIIIVRKTNFLPYSVCIHIEIYFHYQNSIYHNLGIRETLCKLSGDLILLLLETQLDYSNFTPDDCLQILMHSCSNCFHFQMRPKFPSF